MNSDLVFQTANTVALAGWAVLLASPFIPQIADRIAGLGIPLVLGLTYAGIVMAFWSSAEGGFDTLDNVALLFQSREMLLAGWLHYLAFDLFVGAWIVRQARSASISFFLVVPCLMLTFLFGPAGLLVFATLRLALRPGRVLVTD